MVIYCFVGRLVCFRLIFQLRKDRKFGLNKICMFEDVRDILRKKEYVGLRFQREGKFKVVSLIDGVIVFFEYVLIKKLVEKKKICVEIWIDSF